MPYRAISFVALLLIVFAPPAARAESARVAVATNFAPAAEALAQNYATGTGHKVAIIGGATGKLYAQIVAGAPFDTFLSADDTTPKRLADEGLALPESRFAYATGRLVLWSADGATDLSDPVMALENVRHVAIANPDLAPYGMAAVQTITALGLRDALDGRLVMGENVGQAHAMTATGAAELGFVAASALIGTPGGVAWPVPESLHAPLVQEAILLQNGRDNPAAKGFLAFLGSTEAKAVIAAFGYGVAP